MFSSLNQEDKIPNTNKTVTKNDDSGKDLWDSAKVEIERTINIKKPKFIIVLGDLQRHGLPNKSDQDRNFVKILKYFIDTAKIPFKIPVIYASGNNDPWDGNYERFFLPDSFFKTYKYPLMDFSEKDPNEKATFISSSDLKEGGYYSAYPLGEKSGLRIIALNTTMFHAKEQKENCIKQINWIKNQLADTKNLKEHVLIVMHIPPGIDGFSKSYMWYDKTIENKFLDLVHDFRENIIGLLASHTHMDGFRLVRNEKKDSITSLLISIPGIAPGHGNNPAIKVIEYNDSSFALQNFITRYMNYWNESKITAWRSSFSFRSNRNYYGDLSMLQYYQQKQKEKKEPEIKQFINEIYSTYGKKQNSDQIDASIYVDYRQ